jgi:hypothetical protein
MPSESGALTIYGEECVLAPITSRLGTSEPRANDTVSLMRFPDMHRYCFFLAHLTRYVFCVVSVTCRRVKRIVFAAPSGINQTGGSCDQRTANKLYDASGSVKLPAAAHCQLQACLTCFRANPVQVIFFSAGGAFPRGIFDSRT